MNESKLSPFEVNNFASIVVMDLQERLVPSIASKDVLLESNALLIKASKLLNLPVVVTEQVPSKLGRTIPELLDGITNFHLIEKSTFSALGTASFTEKLKQTGSKHLILSGIETPICIYQTALDSLVAGYSVTVLCDCVGARRLSDQEQCLSQLRYQGVDVIPLESFLYRQLQNADHESFREISALIRTRSETHPSC